MYNILKTENFMCTMTKNGTEFPPPPSLQGKTKIIPGYKYYKPAPLCDKKR